MGIPFDTAWRVRAQKSSLGEPFTKSGPLGSQKSCCTSTSTKMRSIGMLTSTLLHAHLGADHFDELLKPLRRRGEERRPHRRRLRDLLQIRRQRGDLGAGARADGGERL